MKKLILLLLLFTTITLSACDGEEPEEVTLELIGDETVRIEEGNDYVEQGVLVNGIEEQVSYQSNVNTDRVGTYYVEFQYGDKIITRTVEVVEGARTQYLELVDLLESLESYSYTFTTNIEYNLAGIDHAYYDIEDYDVYGDWFFGEYRTNRFDDSEYVRSGYIYHDRANLIQKQYLQDEYSIWYHEQRLLVRNLSLVTDFKLEEVTYVSKEIDGDEIVYSVFLDYEGFKVPFLERINFFENEHFPFNIEESFEILVTVKDGNIIKIEADYSSLFNEYKSDMSTLIVSKYSYIYEFSNHNTVEEIIVPQEFLDVVPTS